MANVLDVTSEGGLLTTGQVARLLGVTTQHVRNLCDRGELPAISVGSHRRVRRTDFETFRDKQGMLRDQMRSLWLHQAVAGKLVMRHDAIIRHAQRNLTKMREQHPRGRVTEQFSEWQRLLEGPTYELLNMLTSSSKKAIQLRQNSPFAGVLTENERRRILENFRQST